MNTLHSSSAYDVAIIGAGIAGLSAGVALARNGIKSCIIAPQMALPELQTDVYDLRVYAISPSNQQFLAHLGGWETIDPNRITTVSEMQVFGDAPHGFAPDLAQSSSPLVQGHLYLKAWQAASQELTWIVESREIERALRQVARILGVHWIDAKCTGWQAQDSSWTLALETGHSVRADLIVGADGANSWVRQQAGITVQEKAYDHIGLIGHYTVTKPHLGCAYQWFGPEGILALLPLPDTQEGAQVSIVWSMTTQKAENILKLSHEEQAQMLPQALEKVSQGVLGNFISRTPLQGFPLRKKTVSSLVAPGIALVGDAAHQVHPMAGQGLNLGLGDVAALSKILATRAPVRSVADSLLLAKYARERAEPIWAMQTVTEGLYHVLHPQNFPLKTVANLGMSLLNHLPPLKRFLVQKAF